MESENITQQTGPNLRICKITEIMDETPSIKTFYFDDPMTSIGGQFVMVWVPGVDEIPRLAQIVTPALLEPLNVRAQSGIGLVVARASPASRSTVQPATSTSGTETYWITVAAEFPIMYPAMCLMRRNFEKQASTSCGMKHFSTMPRE